MEQKASDGVLVEIKRGKLSLPSDCKWLEGEPLVITAYAFADSCIAIYTQEHFHKLRTLLMNLSPYDYRPLQMLVIGNAEDSDVASGTISVSKHLRDLAELKNNALWIQRNTRVEIWNPKSYELWSRSDSAVRSISPEDAALSPVLLRL